MKQLAMALVQYTSFRERQKCLSESLDHLSFNYPDIYAVLYREIKRREIQSNDPNKISKWLRIPRPKLYVKLHESLMMVKNNNLIAKDVIMYNVRGMLYQTIKNGTDIEASVKICQLIRKSTNLKIFLENLKELISQVNQLYISRHQMPKENMTKNIWTNNSKPPQLDPFQRFNFQSAQQRHTSVWQNMLQSIKSDHEQPRFSIECYGYNHLEMTANSNTATTTTNSQTLINPTIINQEMDGAIAKWLHYLKLHKYQWFFNSLSYDEIVLIDEDNMDGFIAKVNVNSITKGAQKKICKSTKLLRDRPQKLNDLLLTLDLELASNELCEIMSYMRDILHYPIPNKNCVVGDQLQQDIILVMEKLLYKLLEKLNMTPRLVAQSLLGISINKYLECTMLIIGNQVFMKHQIDKTLMFADTLRYKVHRIPRNFD